MSRWVQMYRGGLEGIVRASKNNDKKETQSRHGATGGLGGIAPQSENCAPSALPQRIPLKYFRVHWNHDERYFCVRMTDCL